MRIALVSETYLPQINGVSRTLTRLVNHCVEQGDRMQLLVPRYRSGAEEPGPSVRRRSWRGLRLPFYREVRLPLVTPRRIRRTLEDFDPQVVHIATEGPLGWSALQACRRLKLPVVSSFHTNFPHYLASYGMGRLEPLAWRYLRWFHNATRATLCPTPSIRELLLQRGFRHVAVWGRGVDSDLFHPDRRSEEARRALGIGADDLVIAYVGRLAAEKNLEQLCRAWRLLPEKDRRRLLLVGDGPMRGALEAESDGRMIFAGYRRGEDLARCYAAADLFVFPSLTDTFGNVMLEAMASGLPVVGFDVAGPRDVIRHGITGLVVGERSAEALARAMAELLDASQKRAVMAGEARRYAESQAWDRILECVREQYRIAGLPPGHGATRSDHVGPNSTGHS